MTSLACALAGFDPVSLEALGPTQLLDRVDEKYVLPECMVPDVLEACRQAYRVLEVRHERSPGYLTVYFDTDDLRLYHAHHAGHVPRHKVRVRTYQVTGERFLEVKLRTNTGRTEKTRVLLAPHATSLLAALDGPAFPQLRWLTPARALHETLDVAYTRITLAARDVAERVTIDSGVAFAIPGKFASLDGMVVAEIKQQQHAPSIFRDALRACGVRPSRVSKYCLGVALLYPQAKQNNYKSALARIRQLATPFPEPTNA